MEFKFKPSDEVGGGSETPEPTECTEHVDADSDEKCDVCQEDMPVETATVQLSLTAFDEIDADTHKIGVNAKLEMLTDKTWVLSLSYDGGTAYTETASGTWAQIQDWTAIDLPLQPMLQMFLSTTQSPC